MDGLEIVDRVKNVMNDESINNGGKISRILTYQKKEYNDPHSLFYPFIENSIGM